MTDFLQRADHRKADRHSAESCCRPRGAREKRAPGFVAKNDHGALLRSSMSLSQRPSLIGQIADLVEFGGNAHDLPAGLEEIAHRADVVA